MDRYNTLIVHDDPKSPVSEAFRTLRTNIQFSVSDKDIKKIVITSASPGDGKSTVATNLAIAIAQSGKKCCILDCDLRRPVQHKHFNMSNRRGLVNLLVGDVTIDEVSNSCIVPNLTVIPSGPVPPNPAELIGSHRMDDLLATLDTLYDTIIMDCPPIMAVTDAVAISTKADGVLLVIGAGITPRQMAINAKNALVGVGAHLMGVVLNQVDNKNASGYYYYYDYYGTDEK